MIIRFALTLLLISISIAVFLTLKKWQIRRANRSSNRLLPVGDGLSLLYFSSESCAPCKTQDIYLNQLKSRNSGELSVEKIDVDADRVLADQIGVFTLPTTVLVDESGQVRYINYGLTTNVKLEKQLEKLV